MKICLDLDGVLCELRREGQTYGELAPIPGAAEKVQALKTAGHYNIITTARHFVTCEGNVGKILARQGKTTLDWLERHNIPYDEIHFGKPHADVYVDDNAFRFSSWEDIDNDGANLPASHEKQVRRALQPGALPEVPPEPEARARRSPSSPGA